MFIRKIIWFRRSYGGDNMICKYCKQLRKESEKIKVSGIHLNKSGYHNWTCPINFCPNCGTKVNNAYKTNHDIIK
jgi:hypothetical protein